ncbi:uncharacterized protein EV154DRAFT_574277 [Mucor mucedo]|uniref:uncharacterized protein n=1 Tax=Mucor mucedo TaxID=29922 RepID=UPI00221EE2EA|nr:uncharacterized protein EV154DRAFT_574277 [Mucor mucedo]KAI7895413.1 hypothetical protein EV154DRAFT_574277 [Mucor mucedo]
MFPTQQNLDDHAATVNYDHFIHSDQFPFTTNDLVESLPDTERYYSDSDPAGQALLYKNNLSDDASNKKYMSKSERRAEHNALERARRESLNTKFQSLAQLLPNLLNYRRPSKSQIVEKTLEWVKKSIARDERQRYQILQLQLENKRLISQCLFQKEQTRSCSSHIQNSYQQQENTPIMCHSASNNNNITSVGSPTTSSYPPPSQNIYPNEFMNLNNWIIHPQLLDSQSRDSVCSSFEEIVQQNYSPQSDEDSLNEDVINHQYSFNSTKNSYLPNQQNKHHRQFMVSELYPSRVNTTNYQSNLAQTMNGKRAAPRISGGSAHF